MRLTSDLYYELMSPPRFEDQSSYFPVPFKLNKDSEHYPVSNILNQIFIRTNNSRDIIEENEDVIRSGSIFDINNYPNYIPLVRSSYTHHRIGRIHNSGSDMFGGLNHIRQRNSNYYDNKNNVLLLLTIEKKHFEYFIQSLLLKNDVSSSIFTLWLARDHDGTNDYLKKNILVNAKRENIKIITTDSFNHIFDFYTFPTFATIAENNEFMEKIKNSFISSL